MAGSAELNVVVNLVSKFKDGIPGLTNDAKKVTETLADLLKVPANAGKGFAELFNFDGRAVIDQIRLVREAIAYLEEQLNRPGIKGALTKKGIAVADVLSELKSIGDAAVASLSPVASRLETLTTLQKEYTRSIAESRAQLANLAAGGAGKDDPQVVAEKKALNELLAQRKLVNKELAALRNGATLEEAAAAAQRVQIAKNAGAQEVAVEKQSGQERATTRAAAMKKSYAETAAIAKQAVADLAQQLKGGTAAEEAAMRGLAVNLAEELVKIPKGTVTAWKQSLAEIETVLKTIPKSVRENGTAAEKAQIAQLDAMAAVYRTYIDNVSGITKGVARAHEESGKAIVKNAENVAAGEIKAEGEATTGIVKEVSARAKRIAQIQQEIAQLTIRLQQSIGQQEQYDQRGTPAANRQIGAYRELATQIKEIQKQIRGLNKEMVDLAQQEGIVLENSLKNQGAARRRANDQALDESRRAGAARVQNEEATGNALQALAERQGKAATRAVQQTVDATVDLGKQEIAAEEQQENAELVVVEKSEDKKRKAAKVTADVQIEAAERSAKARIKATEAVADAETTAAKGGKQGNRAQQAQQIADQIADIERNLATAIERIRKTLIDQTFDNEKQRVAAVEKAASAIAKAESTAAKRVADVWVESWTRARTEAVKIPKSASEVTIKFYGEGSARLPISQKIEEIRQKLAGGIPKSQEFTLKFANLRTVRDQLESLDALIRQLIQREQELERLASTPVRNAKGQFTANPARLELIAIREMLDEARKSYASLTQVAEQAYSEVDRIATAYSQEGVTRARQTAKEQNKILIDAAIDRGNAILNETRAAILRTEQAEKDAFVRLLQARSEYVAAVKLLSEAKGADEIRLARELVAEQKLLLQDAVAAHRTAMNERKAALAENKQAEEQFLKTVVDVNDGITAAEKQKNAEIEKAWAQHSGKKQQTLEEDARVEKDLAEKSAAHEKSVRESTVDMWEANEKQKTKATEQEAKTREKWIEEVAQFEKQQDADSLQAKKEYISQKQNAIRDQLDQAKKAAAAAAQAMQDALAAGSKKGAQAAGAAFDQIAGAIASINTASKKAGDAMKDNSQAGAFGAAKAVEEAMGTIRKALASIGMDLGTVVTQNFTKVTNATKMWEDRMNSLSYRFTHVGFQLGIFGAAAMEAFKRPIEAAKELDKIISYTGAIAEASVSTIDQLRETALSISSSSIYSSKQVAEGMRSLVQAGLSAEESMQAVKTVLDFASAGMLDLDKAGRIAISTMYQFGLTIGDLPEITNEIQAAANRTNAEVKDFGEALKNVGPTAKAVGASLHDTVVALGLLSQAGINASTAGTQLRGVYRRLLETVDAGSKAGKIFASLGLKATDASGKFKSLEVVINDLIKATDQMSDEQRASRIYAIFGQRAGGPAVIAMMNQQIDALKRQGDAFGELSEKIRKAAEQQQIARERSEALWGSLERLKNTFTNLLTTIGFAPNSALKTLVNTLADITEWVRKLIENSPGLQRLISGFLAFAAISGAVTLLGGAFALMVGNITSVLGVMGPLHRMLQVITLTMNGMSLATAKQTVANRELAVANGTLEASAVKLNWSLKGVLLTLGKFAAALAVFNAVFEVFGMAKNHIQTTNLLAEAEEKLANGFIKDAQTAQVLRGQLAQLADIKNRLAGQKALSAFSFGLLGDTAKLEQEYEDLKLKIERTIGKDPVKLPTEVEMDKALNQAKRGAKVIITELDMLFGNTKFGIDKFDLSKVIDAIDKTDGLLATLQATAELTGRRMGKAFDAEPINDLNLRLDDGVDSASKYETAFKKLGLTIEKQTARELELTDNVKKRKIAAIEEYFTRAMDATQEYVSDSGELDQELLKDRMNAYEMTLGALDKMYQDALQKMEKYAEDILKAEQKLAQDRVNVEIWAQEQMGVSDKLKSDAMKAKEHIENLKKLWAAYVESRDAGDFTSARKNLEAYQKLVEKTTADVNNIFADALIDRDKLATEIAQKEQELQRAIADEAKKDSDRQAKNDQRRLDNAREVEQTEHEIARLREEAANTKDSGQRQRILDQIAEKEASIGKMHREDAEVVDQSDTARIETLKREIADLKKKWDVKNQTAELDVKEAQLARESYAESTRQLSVEEETANVLSLTEAKHEGINNYKNAAIDLDKREIAALEAKQQYYLAYLSQIAILSEGIRQIWIEINKNGLGLPGATEGAKQIQNLQERFKAITGTDVKIKVVTMADGTTKAVLDLDGKSFSVGVDGKIGPDLGQVLKQTTPGTAPATMPVQTQTTIDQAGKQVIAATTPGGVPATMPVQTKTQLDAEGKRVLDATDPSTQKTPITPEVKFRIGPDDKRIVDRLVSTDPVVQHIGMKLIKTEGPTGINQDDIRILLDAAKKGDILAQYMLKINPLIPAQGMTMLQYAHEVMANELTAQLPISVRVSPEDEEVIKFATSKSPLVTQIGLKVVADKRDLQILRETAAMGDQVAEYLLRINPTIPVEGKTLIDRVKELIANERTAQLPIQAAAADADSAKTLKVAGDLTQGKPTAQMSVSAQSADSQTAQMLKLLNEAINEGTINQKFAMQLLAGKDTDTIIKVLNAAGKPMPTTPLPFEATDGGSVKKLLTDAEKDAARADLTLKFQGEMSPETKTLYDKYLNIRDGQRNTVTLQFKTEGSEEAGKIVLSLREIELLKKHYGERGIQFSLKLNEQGFATVPKDLEAVLVRMRIEADKGGIETAKAFVDSFKIEGAKTKIDELRERLAGLKKTATVSIDFKVEGEEQLKPLTISLEEIKALKEYYGTKGIQFSLDIEKGQGFAKVPKDFEKVLNDLRGLADVGGKEVGQKLGESVGSQAKKSTDTAVAGSAQQLKSIADEAAGTAIASFKNIGYGVQGAIKEASDTSKSYMMDQMRAMTTDTEALFKQTGQMLVASHQTAATESTSAWSTLGITWQKQIDTTRQNVVNQLVPAHRQAATESANSWWSNFFEKMKGWLSVAQTWWGSLIGKIKDAVFQQSRLQSGGGGGGGGGFRYGGLIHGMARGGHLGGYGGGDRRLVMLEDGEYVMTKEATRAVGVNYLDWIRRAFTPGLAQPAAVGPRLGMASGGPVSGATTTDLYRILERLGISIESIMGGRDSITDAISKMGAFFSEQRTQAAQTLSRMNDLMLSGNEARERELRGRSELAGVERPSQELGRYSLELRVGKEKYPVMGRKEVIEALMEAMRREGATVR